MNVTKRTAGDGDHPFLQRLYASTRDDIAQVDFTDDERNAFLLHQWDAQHRDYTRRFPQAVHQIIEVDGQDVGRTWVDRRHDEIRLLDIALLPDARNRGLGKQLLRELQDEARAAATVLRHSVEVMNPDALRFYERLGFTVVDDWETHLLMQWDPVADQSTRENTIS